MRTGNPHSTPPLSPEWRGVVNAAVTERELMQITRDYLACWSAEEIAQLPESCRPAHFRDAEEITLWAFELASAYRAVEPGSPAEPLLMRMMLFATEVSTRIARLKAMSRVMQVG